MAVEGRRSRIAACACVFGGCSAALRYPAAAAAATATTANSGEIIDVINPA